MARDERPDHDYEAGIRCKTPPRSCLLWAIDSPLREQACAGCRRCVMCSSIAGCPSPREAAGVN